MDINMEKLKDLFAELERDWGHMEYTAIKKNINVGCELAREIERLKKEKACLQEEINKLRGYKNLENLDELQERYIAYLKEITETTDSVEDGHYYCDNRLCDLLTELGFTKVVEQYDKQDKWYA